MTPRQTRNRPLRDQYLGLYEIIRNKHDTIAQVLSHSPPNILFRRDLVGPKLQAWNRLVPRLGAIKLTQDREVFRWNLHRSGSSTVIFECTH
ncbi:hypothetical protein BRADI_1g26771v3 [Brachypodium distachyon]|uniref:Uncharacterized protein n=1 Tax=Brachypodium distachyon TaxID=15368 RepID=A0A2K2DL77_BRADI|nr:hypothetical protein BRADI_1g26771v3 [Brachypodium distachyon]